MEFYTKYNADQISKIGNTITYLCENIVDVSKTKILKLIYILDELSIRKSGIPFLNLKYKVWKFGPVSEDIFIELSSSPTILKNYVKRNVGKDGNTTISALMKFNDDEFSDNDIDLMDFVIDEFGSRTANELIKYTHRKTSPWYISARDNSVLELLEREEIGNTEFIVDLGGLIKHDSRKNELYQDFIAHH